MLKRTLFLFFTGIAYGCTILTVIEMCFAASSGGDMTIASGAYLRYAVCSMLTGAGFTVPTLAYRKESWPKGLQVLVHMGTGFIVYFPCAFYAGWIQTSAGAGIVAGQILIALAVSWLIWLGFYLRNKREAEKINSRLRSRESETRP